MRNIYTDQYLLEYLEGNQQSRVKKEVSRVVRTFHLQQSKLNCLFKKSFSK